ncbi:hypothetical protein KF728_25305 [Candidatus Obscuribacterales bacterium]|nr:hypothetical protein [Candidatus Obscuribacterales bacterium]MBX3153496.1 hypothetical protein [Candidatus Obscuribacterales bacterium]
MRGWLAKEHLDVHPGMLINQRARLARLELDDGKLPEARLNFESALIGFEKLPAKGPEVNSVSYSLFSLAEHFEETGHGADCREDINKLVEIYGRKYRPIELSHVLHSNNLIAYFTFRNEMERPRELLSIMLKSREEAFGKQSIEVTEILDMYSDYWRLNHDLKNYERVVERTLKIRERDKTYPKSAMVDRLFAMVLQYSELGNEARSEVLALPFRRCAR